ncbi:hypothetical protein SAMN05421553_1798 [Pseudomonas anguilliseptica]|uniref:Uncharacterized protein n=1 Tax=Pseudomonas anguilliseptica TaxID=53406 RepID=A0A1H4WY66_PSEAG|nr:hypothetical protein SAMN05421553_1798 [Pseudomonas anguilliseptica]
MVALLTQAGRPLGGAGTADIITEGSDLCRGGAVMALCYQTK